MTRAAAGAALALVLAAGGVTGASAAQPSHGELLVSSRSRSFPSKVTVRASTTWCGSASTVDRVPNAVAGYPVHWLYVIPSDGEDRLATIASQMQTDAEEIDAWWKAQDPTRSLRNDVAQFSCGLQLDITTLRAPRSAAQLTPLEGRFAAILGTLTTAGFRSPFTKYLVYYDGPSAEDNVCGEGGSDPSGFGLAVVFVRSCAGVSTAAVAVHEVLHGLGAVPRGAPHLCPDGSHVCDDESDIMYPAIGDEQLSGKPLDPGRDDYYGHPGTWLDVQDAPWLLRIDEQAPLTLAVSGPGTVSADVPGLQCAESCTTTWNAGTQLALTATPASGMKLLRWAGSCTGAAGCSVTVGSGTSVSATFVRAAFGLRVRVSGRGVVESSRAGIACRPRCSVTVASFVPVVLTAKPAKGWKLASWSGACRGTKRSCRVPMSAATSARAAFVRA